jgi:hypothetical protein
LSLLGGLVTSFASGHRLGCPAVSLNLTQPVHHLVELPVEGGLMPKYKIELVALR